MIRVNLKEVVGKGYRKFFKSEKRYLVVKGGRASKKSKTAALKIIYNILKYPKSNALIVRKVKDTLRDSCYADLIWAIDRLKVTDYFLIKKSPMEIIYKPTGQKIIFRGLDDAMKLTSISSGSNGYLNMVWIEEAYEILKEDAFDKLDMSIRGDREKGYYNQIIISFNPWSDKHWLNKRFFQNEDDEIECMTTTYMCNEFLSQKDLELFEKMKKNNPRRYEVEGLGNWGIIDGQIYENYVEVDFDYKDYIANKDYELRIGLDFGYTQDPSALICCLMNDKTKEIYIFDEFYQKNMSNSQLALMIKNRGYAKDVIYADSAEPKSIDELKNLGINRIKPAIKGVGSVNYGIQKIQQYKLIVHPSCVNTLMELSLYCWDKKNDTTINKPIDMNNHLLDALRYAIANEKKSKGVDTRRMVISY